MDLAQLAHLHRHHVQDLYARYDEAIRAAELDAIVIHSGSLRKRSEFDDQYWPLRPVPHFQHWAPLAQPDCAIVVTPGRTRPTLVWLKAFDFWEEPHAPESDHFVSSFDVVEITRVEQVKELLPGKRTAFIGEDRSRAELWGATEVNPAPLVRALDALRTTKTAYEVLCLEEANRRAAKGHAAVLEAFPSTCAPPRRTTRRLRTRTSWR
jgi:Xaa-Pro dipeptidase